MRLTQEIATEVVTQTMKTIKYNINIMDERGVIQGSGHAHRINTFHEGALLVLKYGQPIVIYEKDKEKWMGAKPGVNLPIHFNGQIIGVVGISGNPKDVKQYGKIVVTITEMIIKQIHLLSNVEWQYRTREFLIEDLISENPSCQKIKQRLRLLNIELKAPIRLIVFRINDSERRPNLSELYKQIEMKADSQSAVYGLINPENFVLLAHEASEELFNEIYNSLSLYYNNIQVGIGRVKTRIENLRKTYIEIDSLISKTDKKKIYLEKKEAELLILKVNERDKNDFEKHILKELPTDLQQTVIALFQNNLNLSKTANELFIHRNTLIYRLEKVKRETGYDPRNFHDALTLQLALWCSRSCDL